MHNNLRVTSMFYLVRQRCLSSWCNGARVRPRRLFHVGPSSSSSPSSSLRPSFLFSTRSPSHCLRALSTGSVKSDIREAAELQDKVLRCLDATVFDPSLPTRSIVDLGLVKSVRVNPIQGEIRLSLEYPTAGHPHTETVKARIYQALQAATSRHTQGLLPFSLPPSLTTVRIDTPVPRLTSSPSSSVPLGSGLTHVQHVVAVSSCKGGVGKSTVAVNLALALARQGNRVGLLDLDIYGPSLPTLLHVEDKAIRPSSRNPKFIQPLLYPSSASSSSPSSPSFPLPFPVKHLSFGHVKPSPSLPGAGGGEAAVLRGPLASKVVNQLLLCTEWGELDFLLLDLPPGTGDVQITVNQSMGGRAGGREGGLSGAVVVTTPQELAVVDVVKGVRMMEGMKVPTLACVVNMAYFVCGSCQEKHYVFGGGGGGGGVKERIRGAMTVGKEKEGGREEEGVLSEEAFFELPLSPAVSRGNDRGRPVMMMEEGEVGGEEGGREGGQAAVQDVYFKLATRVAEEMFRRWYDGKVVPLVEYNDKNDVIVMRIFSKEAARQIRLRPADVRWSDPRTGEALKEGGEGKGAKVTPVTFEKKGNYGVSVLWSDGHYASIYTYEALERMAARIAAEKEEGENLIKMK